MSYQSHYFQEVRKAQQRAYVPYSHFKVGAYLKTKGGRHFYGANVENAAYPATICAERSSLVAAISEGYRPGDFESITSRLFGKGFRINDRTQIRICIYYRETECGKIHVYE